MSRRYLVLVPDGAADYALDELDGRTPLQAARIPHMDRLACEGQGGLVQMIPPSRHPGSDVGNLEIFGYDSTIHYTGRAPLEASSMGLEMGPDDIAFRCNLVYCEGDTLIDYSAGHIGNDEGRELIQLIGAELGTEEVRFFPGVGYRHIVLFRSGPEGLTSYPPHDIMGQSASAHLPQGQGMEPVRELMERAAVILATADANKRRSDRGDRPANRIWMWGEGRPLELPTVQQRYDVSAGVISAVDLVRGIGVCAGYEVIDVPGITGYLDTNYEGKAQYALDAFRAGTDLLYVHVEAPDEAGHNGDASAKVQALEDFDARVVGPLLQGLAQDGVPLRLVMTPDHRTPIPIRTHTREPVPFVLWGDDVTADDMKTYDEVAAEQGSLQLDHGHELIPMLLQA
ncbi:MAG: cofactor-independent phosphoglycerate mutase [Gemmatimonadetes bacterium]|nr:cofactor-independent phosphoglycerate mutase [Gemmatimonadota bacterium]MBT7859803.1 cofactor-independent phosphoglycerate mutase [Gemmatimonadota bacterium]